jgi:intracellular sulfur oxidation DsrE/DsrF family protein
MKKLFVVIPLVFLLFVSSSHWLIASDSTSFEQVKADDADALKGVKVGKVVFDINSKDPMICAMYLQVIKLTYDDMVRQNVKPDMILAFRGYAVTYISKDRERFEAKDSEHLDKVAEVIADLIEKGVKIESCAIAMNGQKVKQESLLEGIKTVGNTFISLMGYQIQGYGVIPIY